MARTVFLFDGHPDRPPPRPPGTPGENRAPEAAGFPATPHRPQGDNGRGDLGSFGRALTEAYGEGLAAGGADVAPFRMAEMRYDPVLHYGYAEGQPLEPDLAEAQAAIAAADHLAFGFPVWWGGMPAKMKGFFDRVFLPGFAYRYHDHGAGWDRLLTGRSARLLISMTSPPLFYRIVHGAPAHKQLDRAILGFCGVGPVDVETFGGLSLVQERQRATWLEKAFGLGLKDARRDPPRPAPAPAIARG